MEITPDSNFILPPDERENVKGEDWGESAYCRGSSDEQCELFFSVNKEDIRKAKRFCGECAVREVCLEDALWRKEPYGIRGGLEPKERRKILKARGERPY